MFREAIFPRYAKATATNWKAKRRSSDRGRLIMTATVICAAVSLGGTNLTLAYQLLAILLSLIIISRICLRFQRADITVRRILPRYATVAEPFQYNIQVTNHGNFAEHDLVLVDNPDVVPPDYDQFSRSREPGEETRNAWDRFIGFHRFIWLQKLNTGITIERATVPEAGRESSVYAGLHATPLRRGIVSFRSTTLLCPDPFGLNYRVQHFKNADQLLVLPRRYKLSRSFNLIGGRNFQPGGVNPTWSIGESDEFVSLREYREGDSKRKIHWASSAKRDKPVVKEFQDEFFVREALIVDTQTDDSEILEAVISTVTSLLLHSESADGLIDLVYAQDQANIITSGRGFSQSNLQLEALALMASTTQSTAKVITLLESHLRFASSCLLVLSDWDSERQRLYQTINNAGIPTVAFLIAREPNEKIKSFPGHILDPDNLERDLVEL